MSSNQRAFEPSIPPTNCISARFRWHAHFHRKLQGGCACAAVDSTRPWTSVSTACGRAGLAGGTTVFASSPLHMAAVNCCFAWFWRSYWWTRVETGPSRGIRKCGRSAVAQSMGQVDGAVPSQGRTLGKGTGGKGRDPLMSLSHLAPPKKWQKFLAGDSG